MSHKIADETLIDRLTRPAFPLDLLALVVYVVVAGALLFRPGVYGTPVAVALGLSLLFFAPGYALVSFLFPGATPDDARVDETMLDDATPNDSTVVADEASFARVREHGVGGGERVALGFGVSVALLPVLGIAIALSPWTIGPVAVLFAVGGFTIAVAIGGAIRRLRRPADRRFGVPVRAWLGDARETVASGSATDTALSVGLAAAVLLTVAAIGYAVAAPAPSQGYTDVSLLTQNETGKLVAEDYPEEFEQGESRPLVVKLTNHEGQTTDYSVVVELQRVEQASDGSARVLEDNRLATFTPTVASGESWRTTHDVSPAMTGENLRLTYLVFKGDAPEDPTTENAYRRVHVWVTVTE
jgi:uncharacterized membrane protein